MPQYLVYVLASGLAITFGTSVVLLFILYTRAIPFEQRWKGILQAASELSIVATDLKGTITFFNSGAEKMLGYKAEELIGISTPYLFHDPDEVIIRGRELSAELGRKVEGFDVFVESSNKGKAEKKEWTYIHKNGTLIPVTLIVMPIRNARSEITGHLGVALDISKEKMLEQDLRKSEADYRFLLDHSPNIVIVHQGPRIRFMNKVAVAMLGFAAEEETWNVSMDELVDLQYRDELYSVSRTKKLTEIVMLCRTGKHMAVESHLVTVNYRGEPAQMMIAKDITANKQAAEMNNRLISILEETEHYIGMADVDGKLLYLNTFMKKMLGFTDENEGTGMLLTDLYPKWEGTLIRREALDKASKQGSWSGETVFLRKDYQLLPVYQTILAHKDPSDRIQYYSLVARDLSVIRAEEEARLSKVIIQKTLEAQEKERTALARELHDHIGQSLYFVSINLHTLSGKPEVMPYDELIQSMLEQLDGAIVEIRSQLFRLRPQLLEHLGLAASIQHLVRSYQLAYPHMDIRFVHQAATRGIDSNTEIHLYRIVQEGLSNAIKHAEATRIEIILSWEENELRIQIWDDGRGIDKKNVGVGMGLRHMEERVNALNGTFHMYTGSHCGTKLTAAIPLPPGAAAQEEA
ncbi:PAS domain-containing sensor histidine kinase [Paenibacillus thalictri]|uniref:histidine kinase n=1 Tax=Paenibacillus thalictri TaxID=2527873 RepID=A0A4Q9DQJ3_9BACL|nr:PAS domain S-box protein [Paenibacillus thalictri]TBL76576.1 PAS domain S-box protein [Paenibacillus thalictri]